MDFMPTVQIKNVPPEVYAEFRRRAERAGKSLQEYMLALLIERVQVPDRSEFSYYRGIHEGGDPFVEAVRAALEDVREGRDRP